MKHVPRIENSTPITSRILSKGWQGGGMMTLSLVGWLALNGHIAALGADPLDQWVWRNPLPTGNPFIPVTFANGTFLGVSGGAVGMSVDGTEWTTYVPPPPDNKGSFYGLAGIAYGNNRLVAVGSTYTPGVGSGQPGVAVTSEDRLTWSAQDFPGGRVGDVAYGNGVFVAVMNGFDPFTYQRLVIIQTSPDGVRWTTTYTDGATTLPSVGWVNGVFVVTSLSNGVMLTSPDGVAWTPLPSGQIDGELRGAAYANGTWVVVGSRGVLTSTDWSTWTNRTRGLLVSLEGVAYGNGTFVTVGSHGAVLTSPDAINWTPRASGTADLLSRVVFGNGTFVAGGWSDLLISRDGVNWRNLQSGDTTQLSAVAWGTPGFVAVSMWGEIWHSTDGVIWTRVPEAPGSSAITQGNGRYVAVTEGGYIVMSNDGRQWTNFSSGVTAPLRDITYGSGVFLAVGDNGSLVTSKDGNTWLVRDSGTSSSLYSATYGNGIFVVSGGDGTVLTSTNGIGWTVGTSGTGTGFSGMAYGGGLFVGVGSGSWANATTSILTSTNGLDWASVSSSATAGWLVRVCHGRGIFTAVGYNGAMMTSTNGLNWVNRNSGTSAPLTGVAYGNSTFLTVGFGGTILQSGALPSPSLRLGPILNSVGGAVTVTASGTQGYPWEVQASTNLTTWVPLLSLVTTNTTMQFTDYEATTFNRRFYRAVSQ